MKIPVKTDAMTFICGSAPEAVVDFATNREKVDKATGTAIFSTSLIAITEDGPEVIAVRTIGKPTSVVVGESVRVLDLTATPWSMGERSGTSYKATKVTGVASTEKRSST